MGATEVLIPIFFFITIGVVFGVFILTRHKERMSIIEKGLNAEDIRSLYARNGWRTTPLVSLKWGMVFASVGIAILLGIWLHEVFVTSEGVFPGLIALFGGLGLVGFYLIAKKQGAN